MQRQLKTGQAISGSLPMYQGTWHALTTIVKTEGVRGVYRVSWWGGGEGGKEEREGKRQGGQEGRKAVGVQCSKYCWCCCLRKLWVVVLSKLVG